MSALDDLVRSSLHERAGDITAVPPGLFNQDELEPAAPRRPWLVAAAAAAVVLAVVAIVVALRSRDSAQPRPVAPPVCSSPSASAWRAALTRNLLRTTTVVAGLSDGSFVERDGDELTMRRPSGEVTNLMVLPAHAQPLFDVSGNEFVMVIPGDPHAYVYDSRPVGGSIELLGNVSAVALQDNRLYYASDVRGGEILAYDIERNTTQVLARGAHLTLIHDAGLAVRWPGGHATAHLPAKVRAALAGVPVSRIAYSGGSYEVSAPVGTLVVAPDGSVTGPFGDRGGKYGLGVAGHYLLRRSTPTGHVRIYDTVTRAVLDTGMLGGVQTAGASFALSNARGVRVVDTAALPELRC